MGCPFRGLAAGPDAEHQKRLRQIGGQIVGIHLCDDQRRPVGGLRGSQRCIESRGGADGLCELQAEPIREFDEVPLVEHHLGAGRVGRIVEEGWIDQELFEAIDAVGDDDDHGVAPVMHHGGQRLRHHVKAAVAANDQRSPA